MRLARLLGLESHGKPGTRGPAPAALLAALVLVPGCGGSDSDGGESAATTDRCEEPPAATVKFFESETGATKLVQVRSTESFEGLLEGEVAFLSGLIRDEVATWAITQPRRVGGSPRAGFYVAATPAANKTSVGFAITAGPQLGVTSESDGFQESQECLKSG